MKLFKIFESMVHEGGFVKSYMELEPKELPEEKDISNQDFS
jgi:hypothetical protein